MTGSLTFIAVEATLDVRYSVSDGTSSAEFSWDGFDEGDPVSAGASIKARQRGVVPGQSFGKSATADDPLLLGRRVAGGLLMRVQISQHADLCPVVAHLVDHRRDRQIATLPGMAVIGAFERLVGTGSQCAVEG